MSRVRSGSGCLVLLMRRQLRFRSVDHVQALLDLAIEVHLVTVEQEDVAGDPRFASCLRLPRDLRDADVVTAVLGVARATGATAVITFAEVDIVIAGAANKELGVPWANGEADRISRDKARQRHFLRENDIPSVWYHVVTDIDVAMTVARERGLPLIVKPTRAASSSHVELIADVSRLAAALADIAQLARSGSRNYYDGLAPGGWALLEEYLPGREVTLDAVVLDGEFMLGGVCDKHVSAGPFFEEDLYTLPFSTPDREPELAGIGSAITRSLNVGCTLFNAEFREDADGRFRVVEFSTRISGGHVYRNIKDVYYIDLVRMFARLARGDAVPDILAQENRRGGPRMATCNKVIFGTGLVVRNGAGNAVYSPHFRAFYPMAPPGERVAAAPVGFDTVATLSVRMPWNPGQSPSEIHAIAHDLADRLDVEIRPDSASNPEPGDSGPVARR